MQNVHFLGYKKYEELPNYMRGLDVGLLPTLVNQYTDSMFPMKYFEYIAAGLRVVSTGLSFQMNLGYELEVSDNNDGFTVKLDKCVKSQKYTSSEALKIIGENTWETRVDRMFKIMD